MSTSAAAQWGVGTGLASIGVLAVTCNPLTASLGAANIALYSAVYTPMKQHTTWNTWVGAVVGALPPVMGYTAAAGGSLASLTAWEPLLLGSGLFFWQFPHFFALAWMYKKDYSRGNHHMVPCFDIGGVQTGKILTRYAWATSVIPFAAYGAGVTSIMFPIESLAFNGYMLWATHEFKKNANDKNARRVFKSSLWYLPVFMGAFVLHSSTDNRKTADDNYYYSNALNELNAAMKEKCIHEYFLSPTSTPLESDSHEGFCPVTKVEGEVDRLVQRTLTKHATKLLK